MTAFVSQSLWSRFFALGLFLVLVGSGTAAAQPTVSLRGNVGASFFRSPDLQSELLNSGTSLGLEAGVRVYQGFSITLGGGYDRFTLNKENVRLFAERGGDWSFLSGTVGLRYTYLNNSDAHPYLAAGIGSYRLRSTNRLDASGEGLEPVGEDAQQRRYGLHVALGSVFRLDDTYALFFEPRYVFYDLGAGVGNTVRYFTLRLGVDVRLFAPQKTSSPTPPQ
jgi:opacity protein-like surface antigen